MSIKVKPSKKKPEPDPPKPRVYLRHIVERRCIPGYLGIEWDREWVKLAAYREEDEAIEAMGKLEDEYANQGFEFRWRMI